MLDHAYGKTQYCGVGAPGNGRYIIDECDATDKRFISRLTENVKLPGYKEYNNYMEMHTNKYK